MKIVTSEVQCAEAVMLKYLGWMKERHVKIKRIKLNPVVYRKLLTILGYWDLPTGQILTFCNIPVVKR